MEKNDKGQYLAVPDALAANAIGERGHFTRYNGGWIKSVNGLDKSKTDGYSLLGDFLNGSKATWMAPGLYLDCSIGGSRKNQDQYHHLFILRENGETALLAALRPDYNWAVKLWPIIEGALSTAAPGMATILESIEERVNTAIKENYAQYGHVSEVSLLDIAGVEADLTPKEWAAFLAENLEYLSTDMEIEHYYNNTTPINAINIFEAILRRHLLDVAQSCYSSLVAQSAEVANMAAEAAP